MPIQLPNSLFAPVRIAHGNELMRNSRLGFQVAPNKAHQGLVWTGAQIVPANATYSRYIDVTENTRIESTANATYSRYIDVTENTRIESTANATYSRYIEISETE